MVYAFEHPCEVFEHISTELQAKFDAFRICQGYRTLAGEYHAGEIFGELLLDVLLIVDGVTALARLATKLPGLLKILPRLQGLSAAVRGPLRGNEALSGASKAAEPTKLGTVRDAINPTEKPGPAPVADTVERGSVGAMRRRQFEAADYHGKVDNAVKSRGPINGQDALDASFKSRRHILIALVLIMMLKNLWF